MTVARLSANEPIVLGKPDRFCTPKFIRHVVWPCTTLIFITLFLVWMSWLVIDFVLIATKSLTPLDGCPIH